ncbi:hypothetical protein ACFCYB_40120 [Streptomyces sp. NPDC056309]|uniref:hypothetical protein n=1 Tax=unclassified Streptomyces TaxID=2593676 RepID=UPI0035E2C2DF
MLTSGVVDVTRGCQNGATTCTHVVAITIDVSEVTDERALHLLPMRVLPAAVVGRYYGREQTLLNGDFTIRHRDLLAGDLDRIERLQPTRRSG